MSITPASWVFLFLACVFLPMMAIWTAFRTRQPGRTPTRSLHLISVVMGFAITLLPALSAARYDQIELFPRPTLGAVNFVLAAVFLLLTLGTLPLRWRSKPSESRKRMLWMLPHRTQDLWWWALVALGAGIVEEIVFRGVMMSLWQRVLGSWGAAVAVCVVVFSLVHFVQGWRAMATIAMIALAAHVIVRVTGDLYTAMFVHFVYDFFAGLLLMRFARRDGVLVADTTRETA